MPYPFVSVRAVLFDAVGTLIEPEPAIASAYRQVAQRLGSRLSWEEIDDRFRLAFARQEALDREALGLRTDEQREHKRWREIVRDVLVDVVDQDAAFEALWQHFGNPAHWRLDPDAATVWTTLEARGVVMGVASNFDRRLEAVLRGLPPLQASSRNFSSSAIGWRKPALEFFRTIEWELNLRPEQLLLVGDDVGNDFEAAKNAGWHAVLYDPQRRSQRPERVSRLAELLPLLNGPTSSSTPGTPA
jgi:putative hydrolase of the HAD superfamily